MKILVTGSKGFVAKNLIVRLKETHLFEILEYHRGVHESELPSLVAGADFIFHLAGVNRPKSEEEYYEGNERLTRQIVEAVLKTGRDIPIAFSSSIQATKDNSYGQSKLNAEKILLSIAERNTVFIYRLPNVFGKWSKPHYNSVVATFCHSIANNQPIDIHDADAIVNLVYVDDVVEAFIDLLKKSQNLMRLNESMQKIEPVYVVTVGRLAEMVKAFKDSRESLVTDEVGTGFIRALYATYLSFLRPIDFSYNLVMHEDSRGVFVEMLKTKTSGQFSFFTAHPGVTRGGHYHHSKSEKFLIIKGRARYRFRNIMTNEAFEIVADSTKSTVVETVPGWSHDITNIGSEELIVMLWANEIFDRAKPDTFAHEV